MSESYLLMESEFLRDQDASVLSFIGGLPRLPAAQELPTCKLCGAPQTFFFQLTFPSDHFWGDLTMAVFACTSCAHEDFSIPEMLDGELLGAVIPSGFLEAYQRNFRVLVFDSRKGVLRYDYPEKVKFKPWRLLRVADPDAVGDKVGGNPTWYLEDETPGSYEQVPMGFLMQISEEFRFEILPTAPPQVVLDLSFQPEPSPDPWYSLFLQNNLYFFGTRDRTNPQVYILTQI